MTTKTKTWESVIKTWREEDDEELRSECYELTPSDFGIESDDSNDFEYDEYYQNRLTQYDFDRFAKMEERFEKRMKNKKRKINKKIEFDKIIQSREECKNIYSDKRLENMIKKRVRQLEDDGTEIEFIIQGVLIVNDRKYDKNDDSISQEIHMTINDILTLRQIVDCM